MPDPNLANIRQFCEAFSELFFNLDKQDDCHPQWDTVHCYFPSMLLQKGEFSVSVRVLWLEPVYPACMWALSGLSVSSNSNVCANKHSPDTHIFTHMLRYSGNKVCDYMTKTYHPFSVQHVF